MPARRPRNDPRQYDDLAGEWWRPDGAFAALHWLARARGQLVPAPAHSAAALLDVGCGGGLLAPHVAGYRHVGVDVSASALDIAAEHGVEPVQADAADLPFPDDSFDVVVAGEIFEHVEDLGAVVAEAARVLRPGGTLVCDTINRTLFARLSLVTIGERLPGGPPPGCHDPNLFVPPAHLQRLFASHGIELTVWGLRPSLRDYVAFLLGRRQAVRMVRTRSVAGVFQGIGRADEMPESAALRETTFGARRRQVGRTP
jgi:2-polyprenyl-6-hydroxyphenyl methylase/3-demethylubiquinone-9 3-methyltransferase